MPRSRAPSAPSSAQAALQPPRRVGWETVARLLSLRYNHPSTRDDRELRPQDPVNRAEAAYSVARVLALSSWDLNHVADLAEDFDLPALGEWRTKVLRRAVRFVGYPYVWGGMSEYRQTLFGVTSRGGFDCSGFVWRVYKLQAFAGAPQLSGVLRGRTTYQMSGEVGLAKRVRWTNVKPADVLFFGVRPQLDAVAGHAHRDRPRRRLDGALLRPGNDDHAALRLVPVGLRLGASPAARSRPPLGRAPESGEIPNPPFEGRRCQLAA